MSSAGDDSTSASTSRVPGRPRRLERAGDEARRDQAAEAVAEQDAAGRGRSARTASMHRRQVGEQVVAGGEPAALAVARAVAALVVADDAPAAGVQARRDVRIAADVLAEAVDDDNRPPGVGRTASRAAAASGRRGSRIVRVHRSPPPP